MTEKHEHRWICWAVSMPKKGPILISFGTTRTWSIDMFMIANSDRYTSWEQARRQGCRAVRVGFDTLPLDDFT